MEPDAGRGVQGGVRNLNWTVIALIGGLVLLVLLVAYFASRGNADQDKLTSPNVTASSETSRDKLCASSTTYDLIKRDLFRRAAQVRGSDQGAYDQISSSAVVRMENPVMEGEDSSTGAVRCSGSLSLDLPPGVAVVGDGARSLRTSTTASGRPPTAAARLSCSAMPMRSLRRSRPCPGLRRRQSNQGPYPTTTKLWRRRRRKSRRPRPLRQRRPNRPGSPVHARASTVRAPGHAGRLRCAQMPNSPRSIGRWRASTAGQSPALRPSSAQSFSGPATGSWDTATAARTIRASGTLMSGGCARSATS